MTAPSNRPRKIAVVAHNLCAAGGLSVGRNLLAALQRAALEHTYLFTIPANVGYEEICAQIPNATVVTRVRRGGIVKNWFFETVTLPMIITPHRPDVLLSLSTRGLCHPPCPQAIMVQDAHYFYPHGHYGCVTFKESMVHRYNEWNLARTLRRTDLLLCQTPVAQRRLVETYQFKRPTAVCPNAVSTLPVDDGGDLHLPSALAPYTDKMKLLCLTTYYPHKNLESIPELLHRFPDGLDDIVVLLNIPESRLRRARKLLKSIERFGLQNRIINVGFIPQSDLASYYHHCQALFLPTFLESFSGTYVEAMRYELPILTSDLDFARSVCGDAAVYFDPWDVSSMKDAILRLKNDPDLADRLATRGRVRLQTMFKSWDEIAADMMSLVVQLCP